MFKTREEAVELNSVCAFCNKDKFFVREHFNPDHFALERCTRPGCDAHCKFDHANEEIKITDDREQKDVLAIASGWGSR